MYIRSMDTRAQHQSETARAWRRFRRNRPALAGAWFIGLSLLVALLGYALAPDHSPDANTQIPEIALRNPGFRAEMLAIRLGRRPENQSWWSFLLHGRPDDHRLIAVEPGSLRASGDSIYFSRFARPGREESMHLARVFYAVRDSIWKEAGAWMFRDGDGVVQRFSAGALTKRYREDPPLQSRLFLLGTDKYGRCMFSRLLLGFRVSLLVGCIAVAISLTIGVALGALGGYFGGRLDDLIMLIVNTVWSIPTLLLVFAIVLALGRGIGIIFLAVGLTMWVDVARVVRGQVLSLRELPFVEAARSMGFGSGRIVLRHILPNLLGPVMVVAAGNFATAILIESGLSYLGFGVQPPAPSWGGMLNENYGYAISGKPFLALAPAMAIALTVLAFNLVGNGLRDALDVKGIKG
ncbi:MAG: ABC transporter permease [Saprospiraceae bacterium]|nr:ABC transporter permease [Saprospiraceae bacterium]